MSVRELSPDPPRGRPVGGGGTYRSWEYGGDSPHPSVQDIPALFRKTFDLGLMILKNVRATCCEFSKNRDAVAEDFLKTTMLVPAIIRKNLHRILSKNTGPTNNHRSFPTETFRVVQVFTKNSRARSCGFSKKPRSRY